MLGQGDARSGRCQVGRRQRVLTTCPCTDAKDLQVLHSLKNSSSRGDVGPAALYAPPGTIPASPPCSACGSLPARAIPARALLSWTSCPVPSAVPGWSWPLHLASQQDNDLVTAPLLRAPSHGASHALLSLSQDGHAPGWDGHMPRCLQTPRQPLGQPRSCPAPSCSLDGSEGIDKQTFPSGGCCSRARNGPATRLPRGSHSPGTITRLWVMLEHPLDQL